MAKPNVKANAKVAVASCRRACIVAYDGDRSIYNGWQSQSPEQSPRTTIVDTITKALNTIYKGEVKIMGSGRTDAGVHATGQVFHFDTINYTIPPNALTKALNTELPPSIRIIKTVDVEAGFHASRSATAKTYKYRIINSTTHADVSPFEYRYAWHYPLHTMLPKGSPPIAHNHSHSHSHNDVLARLNKILALYKGRRDYASFCASRSLKGDADTHRTIYDAYATLITPQHLHGSVNGSSTLSNGSSTLSNGNGTLSNGNGTYGVEVFIRGSGFMHRMVRTMVGLAVADLRDYTTDEQLVQHMDSIFHGRNRANAGYGAPPHGLYLHHVEYDNNPSMT